MKKRIINIHIPKTAGTSLRRMIRAGMAKDYPRAFSFVGVDKRAPEFEQFKHLPTCEAVSQHAAFRLPELFRGDFGFMSGHYRYQEIAPFIKPVRSEVSVIAFIRHPVMRTVSDYFYCCSLRHPQNEEFRATYPSFKSYILNEPFLEHHLEYLKPSANASLVEAIESVGENIDFIGRTECFEGDVEDLLKRVGLQNVPQEFENKNHFSDSVMQTFESHYEFVASRMQDELTFYEALIEMKQTERKF